MYMHIYIHISLAGTRVCSLACSLAEVERERLWMRDKENGRYSYSLYGVALVSRIDKNISFFCKRALQKRRHPAKETYNFIDPTDRSHPIAFDFSLSCARARSLSHTHTDLRFLASLREHGQACVRSLSLSRFYALIKNCSCTVSLFHLHTRVVYGRERERCSGAYT